jgi:hypothetical protein
MVLAKAKAKAKANANLVKILNYNHKVCCKLKHTYTIVQYDCETFIVWAIGTSVIKLFTTVINQWSVCPWPALGITAACFRWWPQAVVNVIKLFFHSHCSSGINKLERQTSLIIVSWGPYSQHFFFFVTYEWA